MNELKDRNPSELLRIFTTKLNQEIEAHQVRIQKAFPDVIKTTGKLSSIYQNVPTHTREILSHLDLYEGLLTQMQISECPLVNPVREVASDAKVKVSMGYYVLTLLAQAMGNGKNLKKIPSLQLFCHLAKKYNFSNDEIAHLVIMATRELALVDEFKPNSSRLSQTKKQHNDSVNAIFDAFNPNGTVNGNPHLYDIGLYLCDLMVPYDISMIILKRLEVKTIETQDENSLDSVMRTMLAIVTFKLAKNMYILRAVSPEIQKKIMEKIDENLKVPTEPLNNVGLIDLLPDFDTQSAEIYQRFDAGKVVSEKALVEYFVLAELVQRAYLDIQECYFKRGMILVNQFNYLLNLYGPKDREIVATFIAIAIRNGFMAATRKHPVNEQEYDNLLSQREDCFYPDGSLNPLAELETIQQLGEFFEVTDDIIEILKRRAKEAKLKDFAGKPESTNHGVEAEKPMGGGTQNPAGIASGKSAKDSKNYAFGRIAEYYNVELGEFIKEIPETLIDNFMLWLTQAGLDMSSIMEAYKTFLRTKPEIKIASEAEVVLAPELIKAQAIISSTHVPVQAREALSGYLETIKLDETQREVMVYCVPDDSQRISLLVMEMARLTDDYDCAIANFKVAEPAFFAEEEQNIILALADCLRIYQDLVPDVSAPSVEVMCLSV